MSRFIVHLPDEFIAKTNDNISVPSHFHMNIELLCLISGKYTIITRGIRHDLVPGDIYVALPFDEHEYIRDGVNESIVVIFPTSAVTAYEELLSNCRLSEPIINASECPPELRGMLGRICSLQPPESALETKLRDSYTATVFGELLYRMKLVRHGHTDLRSLSDIVKYVTDNFADQSVCIETAAGSVGYSKSSIAHLLRQRLNMSFNELLSVLRVECARGLLADTVLPMTGICERCGFATQRSFNRIFLQYTNMSPRDWRKYKNR